MRGSRDTLWACQRCLRLQQHHVVQAAKLSRAQRSFTSISPLQAENAEGQKDVSKTKEEKEPGALSRRLAEMAEETMDTGSKSDRKMMQDVGFSEELKQQLEQRIAQASFKNVDQQAMSQANMPSYAGKGTKDNAAATAWQGSESLHDSALRMLDDSHKRLRGPARPVRPPPINLRPAPKKNVSAADRLAQARDKTSIYAISQEAEMTDKQREDFRKELKDRFTPGARPIAASLQGLTSLANERIEDAIARGQFKNITRGKGVNIERDYVANSPFLDTTEYFMNKIIQRQEIVPPWIDKQQELVKMTHTFRTRMRKDWRRHAARMISASGGSVEDQIRRAKGYAVTEEMVNPRAPRAESLSSIGPDGTLTSITVESRIAAGVAPEDKPNQKMEPEIQITVTESTPEEAPQIKQPSKESTSGSDTTTTTSSTPITPPSSSNSRVLPMPFPFRDPTWEATERPYHTLAINELNSIARSYNLMAPKVAQKPYYSIERELNRCFADVAPTLADEILERSRKPVVKVQVVGHREGGMMEKFGASEKFQGHIGTVIDEDETKGYGFKEFWKDLFGAGKEGKRKPKNVA